MTPGPEPDASDAPATPATPDAVDALAAPDASGRRWLIRTAVLLLALVAVLAGLAVLINLDRAQGARAGDGSAALAVAERVAVALASGTEADVPRRVEELKTLSTGEFRTQLDSTGPTWQAILQQGKVDARGSVVAAGLERLDTDRADVLVALTASVRSTAQAQPDPRHYRIAVELHREDGDWRAARVVAVP